MQNAERRRLAAGRRATLLQMWARDAQAFTNAVIASVMAAAAAKIERIAEIAFMAFVLWLAAPLWKRRAASEAGATN